MVFHEHLQHFGPVEVMLTCQQSGQVASECLNNTEKCINTETHNHLGGQVKKELVEVKMSVIHKRSLDHN
jgi:hypothetical protein